MPVKVWYKWTVFEGDMTGDEIYQVQKQSLWFNDILILIITDRSCQSDCILSLRFYIDYTIKWGLNAGIKIELKETKSSCNNSPNTK